MKFVQACLFILLTYTAFAEQLPCNYEVERALNSYTLVTITAHFDSSRMKYLEKTLAYLSTDLAPFLGPN